MAESLYAMANRFPLRLLNGVTGQFDHHLHPVRRRIIEQLFEATVFGIDRGVFAVGTNGVTVRGIESSVSHLLEGTTGEHAYDETGLAVDTHKSIFTKADGQSCIGFGMNPSAK